MTAIDFMTLLEIAILTAVYYWFVRHLQATRGGGLLAGFIVLLLIGVLGFALILRNLDMPHLEVVADAALPMLSLALLVIFQPELRLAIARLGNIRLVRVFERFFGDRAPEQRKRVVEEIASACEHMARSYTGAIIVIQRREGIEGYQTGGHVIDAEVTARLLETIFYKGSPLHDGAVFIVDGRVKLAAAHIEVDLAAEVELDAKEQERLRDLGTRHRAGFNLAQRCDATVVIVSEETGRISVARQGRATQTAVRGDELRTAISRGLRDQAAAPKAVESPPEIDREDDASRPKDQIGRSA